MLACRSRQSARITVSASSRRAQRSRGVPNGRPNIAVLGLVPAGANAELEPAAADDVDGGCDLGQDGRMPVGVAGHQRADADARGVHRQRGQAAPRLQAGVVRIHHHGDEVVVRPRRVVSERLRPLPDADDLLPVGELLAGLNAKADLPCRHGAPPSIAARLRAPVCRPAVLAYGAARRQRSAARQVHRVRRHCSSHSPAARSEHHRTKRTAPFASLRSITLTTAGCPRAAQQTHFDR